MNFIYRSILPAFLLLFCFGLAAQTFSLQSVASYNDCVDIQNAGDERLFLVDQDGRISILMPNGTINGTDFLNISGPVNSNGNERGLLGLAFHPDYASNGYFFVNYTNSDGDTRVARYSVSAGNPDVADATSETVIIEIDQDYSNHNGGQIAFGPDGYLYIGMGDGGSGDDPQHRAQDEQSLLGKMLRIDVDNTAGGNNYAIPADNPFVGDASVLDEIWAIGVRNPWRFSFDAQTGDMWIADVGQNAWEEVDFQPASSGGGENYGWRCREGFNDNSGVSNTGCPPVSSFTDPIFEYPHNFATGGYSITGGYVYRGCAYPELDGYYFFADYVTGNFWTTKADGSGGFNTTAHGFQLGSVATFGVDSGGEIYVGSLGGTIYKLVGDDGGSSRTSIKIILEGAYDAGTGMMSSDYASSSLLPHAQPYTMAPYNYAGAECAAAFGSDIIDWVLVELRDPTGPDVAIERRAGLLRADGMILDVDQNEGIRFVNSGSYYVVVYHKSHLGVRSSSLVSIGTGASYDFTTSATTAAGVEQVKDIGGGVYAAWCGDYDGNGVINNLDFNLWFSDNAAVLEYLNYDGDLNAYTNNLDFNLWTNNRSKVGDASIYL